MAISRDKILRRARRNRLRLKKLANGRPRLCVTRSNKNISAQIIDDVAGVTLAAASTLEADFRGKMPNGADTEAATRIGEIVAERAKAAGVETVVFDRGRFIFHGRVKALAEAARANGLKF